MSDPTPLQLLDDAVHAYAATVDGEDGGAVGAWVLAYEATALIDEPGIQPLTHRQGYAIGPGTSSTSGEGLAASLAVLCRRVIVGSMSGGDA